MIADKLLFWKNSKATGASGPLFVTDNPQTNKREILVLARFKILLPFFDDSTLFFVRRMRTLLLDTDCELYTAWMSDRASLLSDRQVQAVLPDGPDILLRDTVFKKVAPLRKFDAIIVSKITAPMRDMIKKHAFRHGGDRPCMIAFQAGLEFTPAKGFSNRRYADAMFIIPETDIDMFRTWSESAGVPEPYLGFGHPVFLRPEPVSPLPPASRDVYFFAQAISPLTRRARLHLLRVLAAIARARPDRNVWLKLRHLPHENRNHAHREKFSYPGLIEATGAGDLGNLKLTAAPIDKVLDKIGFGITCTSTAAIDLVRAGVPAMVYLDYPENYLDPMAAPMRRIFSESGLIAPLEDVLNLNAKPVNRDWLDQLFCTPDRLIAQVMEAIKQFKKGSRATHSVMA